MRTIDDKQLDELIAESLQRQHTFESISSQVLAEVKRYNRVRKWKTILRLVAFAFGVPTMLAVMGYSAYIILVTANSAMSYMLFATTILSALFITIHSVTNFSLDKV